MIFDSIEEGVGMTADLQGQLEGFQPSQTPFAFRHRFTIKNAKPGRHFLATSSSWPIHVSAESHFLVNSGGIENRPERATLATIAVRLAHS